MRNKNNNKNVFNWNKMEIVIFILIIIIVNHMCFLDQSLLWVSVYLSLYAVRIFKIAYNLAK